MESGGGAALKMEKTMKKIIFASMAAVAALGVSACSEKTEDNAAAAVEGAANDTAVNAEMTGDAIENAATDVGNATANGAAAVEADVQDETMNEAKKD